MSDTYHFGDKFRGDKVVVHGRHNIGVVRNERSASPDAALRELTDAVESLRAQLAPADRAVIDESMSEIATDGPVDRHRFRRALGSIAGVATIVGQVGITARRNLNPLRRHRSYPRVVKRAGHNQYRIKQPTDIGTRHSEPPTIRIAKATKTAA